MFVQSCQSSFCLVTTDCITGTGKTNDKYLTSLPTPSICYLRVCFISLWPYFVICVASREHIDLNSHFTTRRVPLVKQELITLLSFILGL
jgi:hypothetical protein